MRRLYRDDLRGAKGSGGHLRGAKVTCGVHPTSQVYGHYILGSKGTTFIFAPHLLWTDGQKFRPSKEPAAPATYWINEATAPHIFWSHLPYMGIAKVKFFLLVVTVHHCGLQLTLNGHLQPL